MFLRHSLDALGYIFVADSMRLAASTILTQLASKATKFDEITRNSGYYAIQQGHRFLPRCM